MEQSVLKISGKVIVHRCYVAKDFFSRFMGLMGRREMPKDEALVFPKCNSIHTFFMRIPIDVVFVSAEGSVIEVKEALAPWRLCLPRGKVRHTVELAAHRARELNIHIGDRLECQGAWV